MTEKKMTKREVFERLLTVEGVAGVPLYEEFINHELELLAKKNAKTADGKGKESALRKANKALAEVALSAMPIGQVMTATEVMKAVEGIESNQKATTILGILVTAGSVERTVVKGKPYFTRLS